MHRRAGASALPGMMGLIIGLIISWSSLASAQIQQSWVAKYNNGIPNGNHQALKMALDSTGNIYILGVSANSSTNTGYVVSKYAPNGNQLWAVRYDSTNFPSAFPNGFVVDSSNAVVVTGNAVTVKYDANGNQLWTAPYSALGVGVDSGQNAYITGISNNFTTIKLSPVGSNLWTETLTGPDQQYLQPPQYFSQGIALDASSNVFVAGEEVIPLNPGLVIGVVAVKYDKDGNQLWKHNNDDGIEDYDLQIVGVALDKANNFYIEANYIGPFVGAYSTYKYASAGGGDLASDPTHNIYSWSAGIVVDSSENAIVTGKYGTSFESSIYGTYKISSNGSYIWTNLYPADTSRAAAATALAVDTANNVYVTGNLTNSIDGSDIATIKLDNNGNQLWLQQYDGPGHGNDGANAVAVDNSGNVYVAGYETETNGFTSMILIKYSPVSGQKQSNGDFILHASGSPGETFDIQASTNLQTWQDLGNILADTNGVVLFDDTNASLFPNRFYYAIPK